MYDNSVVRSIIGEINTSIPFKVGVKQGDSMAKVLFHFIIMGFVETLEKEWIRNDLHMLPFCHHGNSPHSSGRIISRPQHIFSEGILFKILCMLYDDNGAFTFPSHKELEIGSVLFAGSLRTLA